MDLCYYFGALALIAALSAASNAEARSYKFRVNCESGTHVVEWAIGSIDPGREYLRTITGTKNPSCMISDFPVPSRRRA